MQLLKALKICKQLTLVSPSLLKRVSNFCQYCPAASSPSDSTHEKEDDNLTEHNYSKEDVMLPPRREKKSTPCKFESRRIVDLDLVISQH
jgi:hypothetical protein